MATLPEGTLTFLLTDIEGSTRLWEQEPDAMAAGMIRHDALFDAAVEHYSGNVVRPRGEGDSRFAVFPGAIDGINAVVRFQRAMHDASWSTSTPLLVRAALHTGEADLRQGDYYGSTVNRCARIRGLAHGGQSLISQTTATLVRDLLEDGITLDGLGEHTLRDLTEPEHIYQVTVDGLPREFPPLFSVTRSPTNLPAETSSFFGREREIEAIRTRLTDPIVRLVTLVGPGGTGKTRLALQAARIVLREFADGVYFVPLASIQDPQLVLPAITQAIGVQTGGDDSVGGTLDEYLDDKRILLLLDNMDHLLDAAPALAGLLMSHPHLKLLVTSRQTLRLRGNQEIAIQPLELPEAKDHVTVEHAVRFPAVRLFVERAREVDPMFEITSGNVDAIVAICQRVDGLPLAIELAAARIRLFSPQALLTRLDRRLQILTGGPVDLPARQQTLRSTIAWSYDFLEPWEQMLFRKLAVFQGGFTLDAASAVCTRPSGTFDSALDDLFDGVASLASKSLLRRFSTQGDDEPRFGMLQIIREYGLEQLEQYDEEYEARHAHAGYFAALAETAEPELTGRDQTHWVHVLERDQANLRAALTWTYVSGESETCLRLAAALWPYWELRGYTEEGTDWLNRTLALDGGPLLRARILSGAGTFAWTRGEIEHAIAHHDEALGIYQQIGDRAGEAFALNNLGVQATVRGEFDEASSFFQRALEHYQQVDDERGIADVLNNSGVLTYYRGNLEGAESLYQHSLEVRQRLGNDERVAEALYNLAEIAYEKRDFETAWSTYQRSLSLFRVLGVGWRAAVCLAALAAVATGMDRLERAARLAGAARSLLQTLGAKLDNVEQARLDQVLGTIQEKLGADLGDALLTEGWLMSLEEAIDYGLTPVQPSTYQNVHQNLGRTTLEDTV